MIENKRILTVDDSATIRLFLRNILAAHRAHIEEATSGAEALALFQAGEIYDLILLDLILPDIDGIDVLRQLRQVDDVSAVVMLTGMGGIKSAMTAVREGADGYMEKQDLAAGVDHAEFFYALDQALKRRAGIVAQQQLQQFKTDFYSMITHDLRNPAGTILSALQILGIDDLSGCSEAKRELLSIALEAAQQTNALINDYLDFAKIDAGYLRLDPNNTELRTLVGEATRLAGMQAQARGQRLSMHLPPEPLYAYVDAERIKQVMENLISNAIKYTPEGGEIEVSLHTAGDEALLQVRDSGIGISPEQMKELFVKYHRGTSKTIRTIRGTGLGLFIVKEIVEAHGGTVVAQSDGIPGKGSMFTIDLPLHAISAGQLN